MLPGTAPATGKREGAGPGALSRLRAPQDPLLGMLDVRDELEKEDGKPEPETVYETNCYWDGCAKEFDTQEQLVHVSEVPAGTPRACPRALSTHGSPSNYPSPSRPPP